MYFPRGEISKNVWIILLLSTFPSKCQVFSYKVYNYSQNRPFCMREERFSFFCQPLAKKQKICYNKENSQCSILNLSQEEQKMKKVLCILLITVCVLALGSCEQLEKLMSFLPTTQSSTTTPDVNNAENKNPTNDNVDETTYDNNHSCTTPDPNGEETKVPEGNGETIVVLANARGSFFLPHQFPSQRCAC